jgi:hypothetical protein
MLNPGLDRGAVRRQIFYRCQRLDAGVAMRWILPVLLSAAYGLSWSWAATDPKRAVLTLALFSIVVTLPYFIKVLAEAMIGGACVTIILIILSVSFPPLGIILMFWTLLSAVVKFHGFIRKSPFMLFGYLLYMVAFYVPHLIGHSLGGGDSENVGILAKIILAIGGAILFFACIRVGSRFGYTDTAVASLFLGFGGYVTLFLLTVAFATDAGGDGMADLTADGNFTSDGHGGKT